MRVKSGQRFEHYQGEVYRVLAVASHSITDKSYIVIQSENGRTEVCPKLVFTGSVTLKGQKIRRFELIKEGHHA